MRPVGTGEDDFGQMIGDKMFYVDKTGFIPMWLKESKKVTLITRPRRFGKTLTLHMVDTFFSPLKKEHGHLFEGLSVTRHPEVMALQGKIPVISVSLAGVQAESMPEFLSSLATAIAGQFSAHRYLLQSEVLLESERPTFLRYMTANPKVPNREKEKEEYGEFVTGLKFSLPWLSRCLHDYYGQKVLVLIDEYDTPLVQAYLKGFYAEAAEVIRGLFQNTCKSNPYLRKALVTGVTRIAKESLFSDFNNVVTYSVISGGYDTCFGFTKEEMQDILEEYGLTDKAQILRHWYDGFTIGRTTGIYNPWSVSVYLDRSDSEPEPYWANTGGIKLLEYLVRFGDAKLLVDFQNLLKGEEICVPINEEIVFDDLELSDAAVWSLMIAAGYMKPVFHEDGSLGCTLTNHEVKTYLERKVSGWFLLGSVDYAQDFARAFLAQDVTAMNRAMKEIVSLSVSSFDTMKKENKELHRSNKPENFFHGLTTGLLMCLRDEFTITSNGESGEGRYDVCLEPKHRKAYPYAAIFEYKVFSGEDKTVQDTARRAQRQITEKRYDTVLKAKGYDDAHILKYGFGFRGKEVLIIL